MKIFLSWSGPLSHSIAIELRDWLLGVLQFTEPYVSSEDIEKGGKWSNDILSGLETSLFGIICVTRDNMNSPWLNFEAGALANSIANINVSPFLLDIDSSELKGPLGLFQFTEYTKPEVLKLLETINSKTQMGQLKEYQLRQSFEVWWPKLKEKLDPLLRNASEVTKIIEEQSNAEDNRYERIEETLNEIKERIGSFPIPDNLIDKQHIENLLKETKITILDTRLSDDDYEALANCWIGIKRLVESNKYAMVSKSSLSMLLSNIINIMIKLENSTISSNWRGIVDSEGKLARAHYEENDFERARRKAGV